MSTVSGSINLSLIATEIAQSGGAALVAKYNFAELLDLPNGVSDNQINKAYYTKVTGVAASTITQYDLVGTLTDKDGALINFDEVVLIAVRNLSSTLANALSVGPHATNGFGILAASKGFWNAAADKNIVNADGDSWMVLFSKSGVPTTAGTADILDVTTQAATSLNTWEILVLGRDN